MTEWKEYKLGELLQTKGYIRGPFGSALKRGELLDRGIPVYEQQHAIYNRRDFRFFINEAKYEEMRRFTVKTDDIIISCSGTVGEVSIIKEKDPKGIISQALLLLRVNSKLVLPNYLLFFLKSKNGHNAIVSCSSGSVQINIAKREVIENIQLLIPSITEQNKIVSILSSLDDKIDLLHRENATLEAMAETLFRQWFVVEAKEEWEEGTVADFAKHCKDSLNPQKHPDTVFQHYSIPAYDDGKKPTTETGENIQSNKYLVPSNCILFSKLNPHKDKRVWLMLDDVPANAICSTEFQIVKPANPEHLYFLYGWLTNKENYDEIASGVGGTSGSHQRIDPKSIFSFACPNVDLDTISKYNKQVEPIFYKQRNNQKQIQTLIQTRDGLLPRLMSGEL